MRKFIIFFCVIKVVLGTSLKIDTALAHLLNTQNTADIFVTFASQNAKIYQTLETQSFSNRAQKIDFLATTLQNQAHTLQQNVVNFLKDHSKDYKSFWISNQIFISKADKSLIDLIANFSEVAKIEEQKIVKLETVFETISGTPQQNVDSWGLEKIQVTNAWTVSKGQGVVVANIDSGVRYTHEALRGNYRSEHGWFDPFLATNFPNDQNGHGTHTMGTIAGSKGIGIAPESKWIACKGCSSSSCPQSELTACGEWILCPTLPNMTRPNCAMAPNVVSNSWGLSLGNYPFYEEVAEAWIAAGIVPVFSAGNDGTDCRSNRSPGDLSNVIGVGSTDSMDKLSIFSSVGPTSDGRIKPDISAPGSYIKSAYNTSDSVYAYANGTSMAAPHVAGAIALILSNTPGLSYDEVRKILLATADTNLRSSSATCGGIADSSFPNNHFGYGRLNAFKAIQANASAITIPPVATTTPIPITTTTASGAVPMQHGNILFMMLGFIIMSAFMNNVLYN